MPFKVVKEYGELRTYCKCFQCGKAWRTRWVGGGYRLPKICRFCQSTKWNESIPVTRRGHGRNGPVIKGQAAFSYFHEKCGYQWYSLKPPEDPPRCCPQCHAKIPMNWKSVTPQIREKYPEVYDVSEWQTKPPATKAITGNVPMSMELEDFKDT